jgi:hypothetical protein
VTDPSGIVRGDCLGTTHIIIVAVTAKHSDASAAKLQDEKGQWIERCHGCRWETRFVSF